MNKLIITMLLVLLAACSHPVPPDTAFICSLNSEPTLRVDIKSVYDMKRRGDGERWVLVTRNNHYYVHETRPGEVCITQPLHSRQ